MTLRSLKVTLTMNIYILFSLSTYTSTSYYHLQLRLLSPVQIADLVLHQIPDAYSRHDDVEPYMSVMQEGGIVEYSSMCTTLSI